MKEATQIGQLVNVTGNKTSKIGKIYLVTFDWFGKRVGSLKMKGEKLHFEGDVDKSAKMFFDRLKGFVEKYIEERLQGGTK